MDPQSIKEVNRYTELQPEFSTPGYAYWDIESNRIPPCDIKLGRFIIPRARPIGSGGYGRVYRAVATIRDGRSIPVVVKISKKPFEKPPTSYQTELLAHWGLSSAPSCSPKITCMYGAFKTHFGFPPNKAVPARFHYCLVLEQMDGDLYTMATLALTRPSVSVTQKLAISLYSAESMLETVVHMYQRGYHHNDVKPENFLYSWNASTGTYTIKASDLGLACLRYDKASDFREISARRAARLAALSMMYGDEVAIDLGDIVNRTESVLQCQPCGTTTYMSPAMMAKYNARRPTTLEEHAHNDFYGVAVSARMIMAAFGIIEGVDYRKELDGGDNLKLLRDPRAHLKEPLLSIYANTPVDTAMDMIRILLMDLPSDVTPQMIRALRAELKTDPFVSSVVNPLGERARIDPYALASRALDAIKTAMKYMASTGVALPTALVPPVSGGGAPLPPPPPIYAPTEIIAQP